MNFFMTHTTTEKEWSELPQKRNKRLWIKIPENSGFIVSELVVGARAANEEEEDPHPRGFWLILLPHSPGNGILDSSYSSFLEE